MRYKQKSCNLFWTKLNEDFYISDHGLIRSFDELDLDFTKPLLPAWELVKKKIPKRKKTKRKAHMSDKKYARILNHLGSDFDPWS